MNKLMICKGKSGRGPMIESHPPRRRSVALRVRLGLSASIPAPALPAAVAPRGVVRREVSLPLAVRPVLISRKSA